MSNQITIVASADDHFAIGLAGTISSAIRTFGPTRSLCLFVLDGGISPANKVALERHWSDPRLTVHWVTVDRAQVKNFVISDHVTDAAYYRLLAPKVLPPNLSKFIYLDSDLLVRRDLGQMWDEPLDGAPCAAIQDLGAPFVDSAIALGPRPPRRARGPLVNECPIPNYKSLGITPTTPYFNSGVMVIDLARWREEHLADQVMNVLAAHREHVTYWDQYALNVVLGNRWKPLSPLWNQNAIVYRFPKWKKSKFCTREFPTYTTDPWIVHFNWLKPWQPECTHPFADDFLNHLAGTPWQITIPARPSTAVPRPRTPRFRAWLPLRRRADRQPPVPPAVVETRELVVNARLPTSFPSPSS